MRRLGPRRGVHCVVGPLDGCGPGVGRYCRWRRWNHRGCAADTLGRARFARGLGLPHLDPPPTTAGAGRQRDADRRRALAYERQQGDRLDDYDRLPTVHATWWLDYGRELTDDNRTALIVSPSDGRMPMSTADAKARSAVRAEARRVTAGAEDRGLGERCLTFGVPSLPGAYNNNLQILQTPTEVALVSEMIHDTRIIPLDAPDRLADNIRLWHGDARGRWEGSTLVVETTNFNRRGGWRGSTESLRLVERFTRVGPSAIQYELTVDAPDTWAEPWTAMVPFRRSDQTLFEYACHEGNRGLYNMLHNARWAERTKSAGQGAK